MRSAGSLQMTKALVAKTRMGVDKRGSGLRGELRVGMRQQMKKGSTRTYRRKGRGRGQVYVMQFKLKKHQ